MTPAPSSSSAPPQKLMRLALGGAVFLTILSGGLFYAATVQYGAQPTADVVKVEVGDKTCNPNHLSVPAGRQTFEIFNASSRPIEWEILQGVMVVEERENIAPGFRQTLTATLAPGEYRMTCGLLSNPPGNMVVTPTAASDASGDAVPSLKAFIAPLSEYKVYVTLQASAFERKAAALAEAVASGDLNKARDAYQATRLPYKQIEAIGGRFADLQSRLDVAALYLEKHEQDPAFTGFHRIEYGLYEQNSLDGLQDVARHLSEDAAALKQRLREAKLSPDYLASSASLLARRIADGRVDTGEDLYAHSDLVDFAANLVGMQKMAALLAPAMTGDALPAAQQLQARIEALSALLDSFKTGDAYPDYTSIKADERAKIKSAFNDLANAFEAAGDALGRVAA
ncbi:multidrug DMT transporter permease (plasmid) [Neorhizobium sp. SOG26]|uniref:iron uptake system protein EfeO n=1 Tax=Neorhizobium sp. SOG26 TaxID=2060726 RepID=UPI000E576CAF|nr:iron uptake system protein EfeO [Neorhizobium sp. SOG26]AXV18273.1 multidrug DMT transporter permease [Neorhizobium sp. SOG26]